MELTRLPEIPYVDARLMAEAGVATVAALASLSDLAPLAGRTGLALEALDGYRTAARSRLESLLAKAGISHEADLAAADPQALASATGLPLDEVEQFQAAARASIAAAGPQPIEHPTVAHEARTLEIKGPEPEKPERVVLADGVPTARLVVGARTLDAVPIVAGRFTEEAEGALARAGSPGVFLAEGASAAIVRVEGATWPDVPIFKSDAQGAQTRVRIKEIRERARAPMPMPTPVSSPQAEAPRAKKGMFSFLRRR